MVKHKAIETLDIIRSIFLPALSTKTGAKQVERTLTSPIMIDDKSEDIPVLAACKIKIKSV
jgi:hypothetical protein